MSLACVDAFECVCVCVCVRVFVCVCLRVVDSFFLFLCLCVVSTCLSPPHTPLFVFGCGVTTSFFVLAGGMSLVCVNERVSVCLCLWARSYVVRMHACVNECMCVHLCTYAHIYICVYIYIFINVRICICHLLVHR